MLAGNEGAGLPDEGPQRPHRTAGRDPVVDHHHDLVPERIGHLRRVEHPVAEVLARVFPTATETYPSTGAIQTPGRETHVKLSDTPAPTALIGHHRADDIAGDADLRGICRGDKAR